jgi:pyrimidine-nucleoside phosphorylase
MSDMDQPLGMAVGNALEVAEAIQTLRGEGPEALAELCMAFGARMLVLGERAADESEARELLGEAIRSGRALQRFREWIEAQGGDPRVVDDLSLLPASSSVREIRATAPGYVARFDAEGVGRSAMVLGAGREHVGDAIDPGAGLVLAVRIGDRVEEGGLLCTMYAAEEELLDAGEERFLHAVHFATGPVEAPQLFHEL